MLIFIARHKLISTLTNGNYYKMANFAHYYNNINEQK